MEEKNNKKFKFDFNATWLYILIAGIFIFMQFFNSPRNTKDIKPQQFAQDIFSSPGDIEKLVVVKRGDYVLVYIKRDSVLLPRYQKFFKSESEIPANGPHFKFEIGTIDSFNSWINDLQRDLPPDKRVSIEYDNSRDVMGDIISWILPFLIIFAIWMFVFRRMSGGAGNAGGTNIFNVGKARARIFDKETSVSVNFNDVAGLEEAKLELREIVDFLKNPQKYTELGGKIPRGALLVGPPGTGKTLLAKAIAGEANVPFFSISGSDFVEMFVGVGASRVRDLFRQAKEKAPCIVFIDEIDAVGRARGRNPNFGANDERENTLNQLLTEMDGFAPNTGVIILAATNRADILDRALLRAGRFDRQIHVELPDLKEREEIFKVHMKPLKLASDIDVSFLSKQTPGFSGADIANACNEAALIAARKNKKVVEKQDFLDAIDRIIGGLEKRNKIITLEEKRTIAFHEAGHATTSWFLEYAHPLVKVSIIPRGRSLGAAWYLPEERQITTREQLLDEMCSALGGRASEQLTFNKISTGALNDLERVTKQAYAMVAYFGMSEKLGNLCFYDSTGQQEFVFGKPYSEKTAEMIDTEVATLVEQQYQRAISILSEHKEGLEKLANLLLEKEVIFSEDMEAIFGPGKNKLPVTGETHFQ